MAGGITALDEAIREYLVFRGFVNTLKQFELEKKEDRDKELNANKIVDHLLQCVERLDFSELRKFWTQLHDRFFSRLSYDLRQTAYKFETSLLRLYLIHATVQGRLDEVRSFFQEMSAALSAKKEWKDWFVLPFTKNPEVNPTFRIYFTREWYRTLNTSLRNFFRTIFTYLPKPALLNFEQEQSRMQSVATENHHLHNQLASAKSSLAAAEHQIQQLEANLAQRISQDAAAAAVTIKGIKSDQLQRPATDETTGKSMLSTSPEVASAAFVNASGEGVLTPYPVGPEGTSPFFPVSQEVYKSHHYPVTHCRFSPNASKIASIDSDSVLNVWKSSSPQATVASYQSKSPIVSMDWVSLTDSLLLLGCADGKIKMFDINSQMCLWDITADHKHPRVVALACSPTNSKCVFATTTHTSSGGSRLSALSLMQSWRNSATDSVTKVTSHGSLCVWDMKSNSKEGVFQMEQGSSAINCVAFNHNGSLLMTGGVDGTIRIFDMSRLECLLNWSAHGNSQVYSAQFSADETSAYSIGSDGKFVQWSIHQPCRKIAELGIHGDAHQPLQQWEAAGSRAQHTREVTRAHLFALEAEGQHVLTAGTKRAIIYQLSHKEGSRDLPKALSISGHDGPISCVDWSGLMNYSTCITGSVDHTVRITSLLKQ